jgi:hypothetical protein
LNGKVAVVTIAGRGLVKKNRIGFGLGGIRHRSNGPHGVPTGRDGSRN